ncbi:MAG: putative metallopeptidase [Pyrobaculum sp.]
MHRLRELEAEIKKAAASKELLHLTAANIAVFYNPNTKSRAVARVWGLGKVFQVALGLPPTYVIELLAAFKRLSCEEKVKAIAHELAHIPRTASGALRPHNKTFWKDYRRYTKLFKCSDFPSLQDFRY